MYRLFFFLSFFTAICFAHIGGKLNISRGLAHFVPHVFTRSFALVRTSHCKAKIYFRLCHRAISEKLIIHHVVGMSFR